MNKKELQGFVKPDIAALKDVDKTDAAKLERLLGKMQLLEDAQAVAKAYGTDVPGALAASLSVCMGISDGSGIRHANVDATDAPSADSFRATRCAPVSQDAELTPEQQKALDEFLHDGRKDSTGGVTPMCLK